MGSHPPALEEFAVITAVTGLGTLPSEKTGAGESRHAKIQRAARLARTPYLLAWEAEANPPDEWIETAVDYLDANPDWACVSDGVAMLRPRPALELNPTRMLARRSALLTSSGLYPELQGVGDGIDLAWRLWAAGSAVGCLSTGVAPCRVVASTYLIHRNWLWVLIRNSMEEAWGLAVSRVLLQIMASIRQSVEEENSLTYGPESRESEPADPIRHVARLADHETDLKAPFHLASRDIGETLTVLHDMIYLLPRILRERGPLQKLRRRSDADIATEIGEEPVRIVERYFTSLRRGASEEGSTS
jgi:hypothetical protein